MDFGVKTQMLSVCVLLIISGIQGQVDDFMKICDLCNIDGLLDCNSTNIFHINMTINCEMTNKMCTLGINESFEGFENLTLNDVDRKHICIFMEMSKDIVQKDSYEHFKTTQDDILETENTLTSYLDYNSAEVLSFKTTFTDEFIESSTVKMDSTINFDSQEMTSDNQEDLTSFIKPTMAITIPLRDKVENVMLDDSFAMQHDGPHDSSQKGESIDPNLIPIPEKETIACFVCDSSTNEACLGRVDEIKTIKCPKLSGCVSYHLNGTVIRNCGSEMSKEDIDLCRTPSNMSCDHCPSGECNNKLWQQCFECNSKDEPNCALWSDAETIPMTVCPNFNDNCVVRITKDKDTLRECSAQNVKCLSTELCSSCEGPLCNSGVYPPDRLQCIQCQECEDAQDPNSALPCLHYYPNDKCFLYVTAKSRMYRGCVSNVIEMEKCQNNEPKCITCNEKNACNSGPLMKKATLSCSKCRSKSNPECIWQQSDASVSKCVNDFLYYLTETCVTQFNPSTEEVVRDCSFDFGVCTKDDLDCQMCPEDGCNRGNLKKQNCPQCQSDQPGQVECKNKAEGIPLLECPEEKLTYENRGCFVLTKGNVTSRGCVANLPTDDFKLCKKDGQTSCAICMENVCNNIKAPSKGSKLSKTPLIVVLAVLFILILIKS